MTTSIRGQEEPVVKPVLVDQYKHYMNGVDRTDQLTVYYSFTRKKIDGERSSFGCWKYAQSIATSSTRRLVQEVTSRFSA